MASLIDKLMDKYIYLKLCFERASTHVKIPTTIVSNLLILSVWLKLYGLDNPVALVVFGIIASIIIIVMGHVDIKKNIMKREMSLKNKHNPEIQMLLLKGEKNENKKIL